MEETLVILPNKEAINKLVQDTLLNNPINAFPQDELTTFTEITDNLLFEAGLEYDPSDPILKELVAEKRLKAINEEKDISYFQESLTFRGAIKKILELFNRLRLHFISSAEFSSHLENKEKYDELQLILDCLNKTFQQEGIVNRYDLLKRGLNSVDEFGSRSLFGDISTIKCVGFYFFEPYEIKILEQFARNDIEVQIFFPFFEKKLETFNSLQPLFQQLDRLNEQFPEYMHINFRTQKEAPPDLLHISHNLFSELTDKEKVSPHGEIKIVETHGRRGEIKQTASKIKKLLVEKEIQPNEIAVVFRSLNNYYPLITEIFDQYDIPFYSRRGKPIKSFHVITIVLSLYDILENDFHRDKVIKVLKSSFVDFDIPAEKLEIIALQSQIISGRVGYWEEKLTKFINQDPEEFEIEELNEIKDRVCQFLELVKQLKGKRSFQDHVKILLEIIQELNIIENSKPHPRAYKALNKFFKELKDFNNQLLTTSVADEKYSHSRFTELIERKLANLTIKPTQPDSNRVKFYNFYDLKQMSFKYIFFCGLIIPEIPNLLSPDPLLNEDEKNSLNKEFDKAIFKTKSFNFDIDGLNFLSVLELAKEKAFLTYPRIDYQGKTKVKSPFLDEITQLFDDPEEMIEELSMGSLYPRIDKTWEYDSFKNKFFLNLFSEIDETSAEAKFTSKIYAEWKNTDKFQDIIAKYKLEHDREDYFTGKRIESPYLGTFTSPEIIETLNDYLNSPAFKVWSITQLQDYNGCPYKFFIKTLLDVSKLEKPDIVVEPVDKGLISHKVLYNFYNDLRSRDIDINDVNNKFSMFSVLEKQFYKFVDRYRRDNFVGDEYLWEVAKDRILFHLKKVIEFDIDSQSSGSFRPEYLELNFGDQSVDQTPGFYKIDRLDGKGQILIRGRIDRIDINPKDANLRMIDYKNSKSTSRDFINNKNLQLPTYMKAYSRLFDEKLQDLQAGFYLIKNPDIYSQFGFRYKRSQVPDDVENYSTNKELYLSSNANKREELDESKTKKEEEIEQELPPNNLENLIEATLRSIESGKFIADEVDCSYCGFKDICRLKQ